MAGRRPNAQNISALKTKIGELSQTNVFQVSFLPPGPVTNFIKDQYKVSYAEKFELLCNSASLPGSRLATHEQTQDFYGVRERYAYRKQFDETLQLQFYVDTKYDVITFFEGWQDYIMGTSYNDANNRVTQEKLLTKTATYRVSYPEEYLTTIFVSKFEKDLRNNLLEYTFTDAFPISFNSMPVQYGQAEVLQMTVDFAYTKYVRKLLKGSSTLPGASAGAAADAIAQYNATNASISADARARGVTAGAVSLGGRFANETRVF